ncbi:MAG: RIO1 family regulatory kinase/ATPase [Nitrososphaerales archaeon]
MSSAEIAAAVVKSLEREEFRVLKAISELLETHESVTVDQIAAKSRMHVDKVKFGINRLNQVGLVIKTARGYSLVMAGLDALALKILVDRNIIVGMGTPVGVGKEADVFEVIRPDQSVCVIKFFRIGRISFRDVKRKRSFRQLHHWLLVNIEAAKREFIALKTLHGVGVKVPKPYAISKHAIVMQKINGTRLTYCDKLDDPERIFRAILENVRAARRAGLISADLSEYNVLYDGTNAWIIDWPQSVSVKHPNAGILLKRDIQNILKFFKRKYGLEYQIADALNYVRC